jgi:hypothetical protein
MHGKQAQHWSTSTVAELVEMIERLADYLRPSVMEAEGETGAWFAAEALLALYKPAVEEMSAQARPQRLCRSTRVARTDTGGRTKYQSMNVRSMACSPAGLWPTFLPLM